MKKKIHHQHDKLFRASMQYPEVAKEFLELHLPESILKQLDLNSIVVCPNSYIDEELQLLQSDVLLKAQISNQETYFYILAEHQKQPDKLMPFRLIKYMIKIWDAHYKEVGKANVLPLSAIFPLVFFTGSGDYNAARTVWDLCGNQHQLMQKIWCSEFTLINVNDIPEEKLTSRYWAGTVEFIMRNKFRQHLTSEIIKIASNLNHLMHEKDGQLVLELLSYIVSIDDKHRNIQELTNIIHDQLSPEVENEIMTLADRLREEGIEKGSHQKELEIAIKMIEEGMDETLIERITKLSKNKIKELQEKIMH